jgi:hypothetical protein
VIAATTPTGDTYADRLREQLLAFFQKIQLDPIPPLTASHLSDVAIVHRLLARAISVAVKDGPAFVHPRPGTGASYLFELANQHGEQESWTFGFSAGELVARVSNSGYRRVELPPDFLSSGIQEQVDALALILRDLPSAPADPTRTGGLAEEDFLAGFGVVRPAIEALFARAEDAGWALRIGSAEATLRPREGDGLVVVYVSAVYGGGPQAADLVRVGGAPSSGDRCRPDRGSLRPPSHKCGVGEVPHRADHLCEPAGPIARQRRRRR